MTWPPHQMTWHASKQVTSPPWNSRRLVHSKAMVWASRWSVALRTFYRQILSLLYSSFSSETSAPGSPGNYLYYRICFVVYLNDSWKFPVRNGTGLCGHDGKYTPCLFVHICSWATGYYPHHDIRSFSSGRFNYIHAYTWIPYTLKLCAIPATCHSNTLGLGERFGA